MKKLLAIVALLALTALGTMLVGTPAQAGSTNTNPVVTIGNVPLPVTGSVSIGSSNTVLPITGTVSISGTPTVTVSNLPTRTPYHFRVSGGFDGNGTTGDNISHTIPAGKTFEMGYVSM
jgi:hypothetical protein